MKTIQFHDWLLLADDVTTRQTYNAVSMGGSESCACKYCFNFTRNKEIAFPQEIKELLSSLGIDYKKECEAVYYDYVENDLHLYGGWFHFKGRIVSGDQSIGRASTEHYSTQPITSTFTIGFHEGNDLAYFKNTDDLVQVEFQVKLPWTIDTPAI